jgi:hypothetical protein
MTYCWRRLIEAIGRLATIDCLGRQEGGALRHHHAASEVGVALGHVHHATPVKAQVDVPVSICLVSQR